MLRNDRIKERRKALGMSADDLAEAAKCNRATIYRYEAGSIKKMDINILKRIAAALGTSAAYLNGDTDELYSDVWNRPMRDEPLVLTPDEEDLIRKLRALPEADRARMFEFTELAFSVFMRHLEEDQ